MRDDQTPIVRSSREPTALRGAELVLRLCVGALLIYSGYEKLRDPVGLVHAIDAYRLFGPTSGLAIAIVLPWLEVISGACLIAHVAAGGAALVAALLGLAFVIAQTTALARGLMIHCGCFGDSAMTVGPVTVARAAGLLAAAVATLVLVARSAPNDASPPAASEARAADGDGLP